MYAVPRERDNRQVKWLPNRVTYSTLTYFASTAPAGGEITASEDFRLLFRRRARFRPVAHGPETAAVRAALPLAPADVATTPGLGVSTTGMGPTSAEPRSARRARGSPWWRPLRRLFKVPTTWEWHTGLFCCGACATSLLMSSLHPPASLVACRMRHWLASPHLWRDLRIGLSVC